MSRLMRSFSSKRDHTPCHCCNDPHNVSYRAIERREVEAEIREAQAEAWDEGHRHCFHVEDPNNTVKGNPYREEQ